jgi:hypothetical protein
MEKVNRVLFVAAIAAMSLVLSAAVLSCETAGEDGEEVVILEKDVTGITITDDPIRTVYGMGETLDLTGLVVTATFEDETQGPFAVTTDHLSQTAAIDTASASVPITITVNGHIGTFTIDVFPVVSKNSDVYNGYSGAAALDDAISNEDTGAIITLYSNQTITNVPNLNGKAITLRGYSKERKITHDAGAAMFNLDDGDTLTLAKNITLDGNDENNGGNALVKVNSSYATLIMEDGSTITGGNSSGVGGGVYVYRGTFTMFGGTISGNETTANGGGVFVISGTFTMSGGAAISGNVARGSGNSGGGGVFLNGGTFTMNDGTISNNTTDYGGGVLVASGTFTMNDGTISDNEASTSGGGVRVDSTFTYNGGTIENNTAGTSGREVFKYSSGRINGAGQVSAEPGSDADYPAFPPP